MFNFITKDNKAENLFYQLPKALIYEGKYKSLSANAKILYSFLYDRTNLSIINNWFDKEGKVYIICELSEIELILNCSRGTANKTLKELEKANLVMKYRNGQGKANFLYVAKVDTTQDTLDTHVKLHKRQLEIKKSKYYTSIENTEVEKTEKEKNTSKASDTNRSTKIELLEVQKLDCKYNKYKEKDDDDDLAPAKKSILDTIGIEKENTDNDITEIKKKVLDLFNVSSRQKEVLYKLDDVTLEKAIDMTLANDGESFSYLYKVYITLVNEDKKNVHHADNKSNAMNNITKDNYNISYKSKKVNKFNNFNQTVDKYSAEELAKKIAESQKRKFNL